MKKSRTKLLVTIILIVIVGVGVISLFFLDNKAKQENPDLHPDVVLNQGDVTLVKENPDSYPKITLNQSEVTLVKKLKAKDGTYLGDVYVTYTSKDLFSSLFITKKIDGKDDILYKINSSGFYHTQGKDEEIEQGNFYGFEFATITSDSISLHALYENGKSESDDATIIWNPNENIFTLFRVNTDDMDAHPVSIVGALVDHSGSRLGGVYISYLDKEKNIIDRLAIVKESEGVSKNIYFVDKTGFFYRLFEETQHHQDLEIGDIKFYGIKLDVVKDDYIIIKLLDENEKDILGDVTIKWNYDKKIFVAQKAP